MKRIIYGLILGLVLVSCKTPVDTSNETEEEVVVQPVTEDIPEEEYSPWVEVVADKDLHNEYTDHYGTNVIICSVTESENGFAADTDILKFEKIATKTPLEGKQWYCGVDATTNMDVYKVKINRDNYLTEITKQTCYYYPKFNDWGYMKFIIRKIDDKFVMYSTIDMNKIINSYK